MKKSCFLILILILAIFPLGNAVEDKQNIYVHFEENGQAYVNFSIPYDTNTYDSFIYDRFTDVGEFDVNYAFLGAHDEIGPTNVKQDEEGRYVLEFNAAYEGLQDLVIETKVPPALNYPHFARYDFSFFVEESFRPPLFFLTYPQQYELAGTYPDHIPGNPAKIQYSLIPNSGLVKAYFIKTDLPTGYSREDVGMYTVVGKTNAVERIVPIVQDMDYVPELFKKIKGKFNFDRINIIIYDLQDKEHHDDITRGLSDGTNTIRLDESHVLNQSTHNYVIEKLIVHEMTHVMNVKFFKRQIHQAQWVEEGLATFVENLALQEQKNITDYWISNDGTEDLFYNNLGYFTKSEVNKQYQHGFQPMIKLSENPNEVHNFYIHSGLIFSNFYLEVGSTGMNEFYKRLENTNVGSYDCEMCDTQTVLRIMQDISGLSEQEILYPTITPENEEILLRKEYSNSEIAEILGVDYEYPGWMLLLGLGIIILMILIPIGAVIFIIWLIVKLAKKKEPPREEISVPKTSSFQFSDDDFK